MVVAVSANYLVPDLEDVCPLLKENFDAMEETCLSSMMEGSAPILSNKINKN